MENCTISNNRGGVGGLWILELPPDEGADTVIENCTITGNVGHWGGGGVGGRRFQMVDCRIMGNSVEEDGAGSSGVGGEAYTLKNCVIAENSGGQAVVGEDTSSFPPLQCFLSNCVISENSSPAAISSSEYPFVLTNCAIVGNSGNGCNLVSGSTLSNCILWNSGDEITGPAEVSYSCIEGGWRGVGNIDADARFVRVRDGETGDFHLLPDSPCIDAGNPDPSCNDGCSPPGLGTERCDIGAYGGRGNCGWPEESELPTPVRRWMLY
jgi:hypothetical protein